MFYIGDGLLAGTKIPGFYPLETDKDHFFVDAPGAGDANAADEFPNMTIVHDIISHAKAVTIVFVFTSSDLEANRGENFLRLSTALYR